MADSVKVKGPTQPKALHMCCWIKMEGYGGYYNISSAVDEVDLSGSIGKFPSVRLGFIPGPSEIIDGQLSIDTPLGLLKVTREDEILIAEVEHVDYVEYIKTKQFPNVRAVLMRGIISDVMYSFGSVSESISAVVESPLIELDTSLTREFLGTRSNGTVSSPMIKRDTKNGGFATTLRTHLSKTYFSDRGERIPKLVDESGTVFRLTNFTGDTIDLESDKDKLTEDFRNTGTYSNPAPGYIAPDPTVLDIYSLKPVEYYSSGTSEFTRFNPWALLRHVLLESMRYSVQTPDESSKSTIEDYEKLQAKVEDLGGLMYLIDSRDTDALTVPNKEFDIMLNAVIINRVANQSGNFSSLWGLISSIMKDMHIYFSPKVLFSPDGIVADMKLGSFTTMSPYREPTVKLTENWIEEFSSTVPGYDSVIKSVGFSDSKMPLDGISSDSLNISFSKPLYVVFKPTEVDWILKSPEIVLGANSVKEPLAASHRDIKFPVWMYSLYLYRKLEIENKKEGPVPSDSTPMDYPVDTAIKYLRSSWMILSRAAVTGKVTLIHTVPDHMMPLSVVVISAKGQDVTGMVASIAVSWKSGVGYNKSVSLSHVTSTHDKYFRALKDSLHSQDKDVLETTFS